MTDFPMSDFLQGRSPWFRQSLQDVYSQMQRNGEIETPDFGGAMPQSDAEWQHHSPSSLLPYASILPPVAAYNAGQSLTQGVMDRDPWAAARGVAEAGLSMAPVLGPMRAQTAATRTAPQAAPRTPPPAPTQPPTGPWQPGHMEQWLQSRYQPAARPQAWQADRRWGSNAPEATRWDRINQAYNEFMYPGLGRVPETLQEHLAVATRQVPRAYAAAAGVAGVNTAVDTLYHGEPWQSASWRHIGGGRNGNPPPAWWPQPPPDEKPLPPSGPMPPSQLRSGW